MFRIATCFVILEICDFNYSSKKANIDGKTNEDKSVHVDLETILAFNNKDNLQNVKLIGNFQDFLTNVRRTVARTGRKRDVKFRTRRIESTRYENATKFTDFIQKLIKILKHYKDHDLEDVFGIAKSVSRIYHYEGCKIDELVSHGIVRRYIDANFEFFNDKPARDIRQGLENLHQLIEDAKYKPKQSQFLDFINSLYTNEHMLEHVKKILDQFESFQMPSKRTTIDLIDLVRDTIRSVIFDHYSNLSLDTRRDFKAKLEALIWDDVKNADKVQHLEWTLDYTEITKNIAPLLRDNTPTTIPDMGIELKTENEFDMVSKENKKGQNIESKSNDDSNDHGISDDDQPENGGHMLGIMTDQDDISINKQDIQIEYNTNEKRDSKSNDTSNDHDISDNDQPENRYQTMGIMMDQDNMRIIKQDSTTSIHHIYSAEEDFTTKRKKYNIFKHTTMFRAPYGEEERILTNGNIAKTPVTKKYKHTDHDSLNLDTETSSKAEKERMTKSPRNILATKTPKKHKLRNTDSRIEYQIVKTKVAHGKGNKHIKNGSLNKYLETIYLDKDDELSMKFSVPKKNYDKRSSEIEDLARSSENIQKFGDLLHDKVSIQDEKSQGVKRSIKNREPKSNMKKGIKTLSEIETLESTEEDVHKKIPRTLSSSIENLSGMLEKESSAMNYMDKESHTFKKKAKRFKVIKKEQSFSKEQSISMKSIEKSVEEEEPYHKVQKSSQKQSTKRKPHKYKEKTIGKTKRPKRIKKEHSFSNEQSISLKSIEKTAEDTEPYQEDLESSYKKPKKKGESKHKLKYKRIKNEHNFSHKNPGSLKSNEMSAEDEEPYQKEHESSYEKSKNKESKNMKEKIKRHKHLKKEHSSSHEQPISLKSFEKSPEDEETYHKELKSSYEKSKNRESHDMKENIKKHKRIKKEHSFSQEELNSLISIENSAEDEESYQKEQESSSENSKIKGSHNLKEKIKRHKVMKKEHVLSHEQSISLKSNEKSAKDKAIKSHKKPKELPKQIKSPKAKGSDIKLKQKRQESSDKQIEKFTTEASRLRKSSRHSTSDTEKHTLEIKSAGSIEDSIATTQNKDETTIKKKDKAGYNVDEYTTLITKITGLVERPLDLKGIDNLDKKSSTDSVFHRVVYDETTNSNEKYKAVNIPIKAHISSRFLDETIVRNSGLKSQFRRSNNKDDDRNTYLAKNARSFVVLSDLVNNQTFNVDFNALSNNLTTAYNQNQSNSMNQDFRRRQIGNRAKMKRLKKMYKTLYSMTTTSPRPSRQIINAITNKVDSSTTTASTTTASEVSSITSTKEEYSTIPATAAFTITFTNKEFTTTFIKYPTIISTAKATSSTKMSTSSISSSEISISNSSTATTPLVTSSDKPTTTQNTTASTTKKKRRKKKKRKRRRSTIKSISTLSSPTSVFTATTVAARSTATKPNITTIIEPSSTTAKPSVTFNELTTISPEPTTTVTNITITDNKTNKTTAMSSQIKQPQDYRRSNILDTAKALESHPNTTKLMKDNAIDLEYANYDVHTTFNNEPVIPDSHKEAKELFERLGIDKDNPKNQTDVDPEYAELPFPHLDKNAELKAEMGRIQVNKDMLNVFGHTARSLPEFSTAPGNTLFTDPFDMISDPLMFEFL